MTNSLFHVIKDPVHGTLQFTSDEDAWVKPFIDSPHFQRLRHIKQLGLGDYIFPGAVHTRFNHSLGCCHVASQIAHKIGLDIEERQLVMIASLLHDIGHGPFSHAFEGIFQHHLIHHEDWTPSFLADYNQNEFFLHYNQLNPHYPLSTEKFRQIADMIMHQPVTKNVLADIVSSQLDADRLDYLLRDGHFCGVRYGEFDFRWMLHCMTIVNTETGKRLGITHKGIGVVEHYLMARRLMTRNIYHSQKKLAIEFFLVKLLASVAEHIETEDIFFPFRTSRLGEFLIAVNRLNQAISSSSAEQRKSLKQHFLNNHYDQYKKLCDYDIFLLIETLASVESSHPAILIAKRLHFRKMPKIIRLDQRDDKTMQAALQDFKNKYPEFQPWQLSLITTPHQSYSGFEDPIFVVNEEGMIKPIESFSFMIKAFSDKFEHIVFLCIDSMIVEDKRIIALMKQLQSF